MAYVMPEESVKAALNSPRVQRGGRVTLHASGIHALIAERDLFRVRLDAVLAMHEINPCDHGSEPHAPILFAFGETCYGPWCRGCGAQYPCRTRRAAEDVE